MKKNAKLTLVFTLLILLFGCSKSDTSTPNTVPTIIPPTADFTFSSTSTLAPALVNFNNNSKVASSYLWDFGDNTTSTLSNPTHTYYQGGIFTIKLTAYGSGGTTSVITKSITINSPKQVKITAVTLNSTTNSTSGSFTGYFKINQLVGSNLVTVWTSETYTGFNIALFPQKAIFTTPYIFTNFTNIYSIEFWKYEPFSFNDTKIGNVVFSPNIYTTGTLAYPNSITIPASSTGTSMTLSTTWQ
jgi:PKD repeat protein